MGPASLAALIIALDVGHGPTPPGTGAVSARGREEVRFNEEVAALLIPRLEASGLKVVRTRNPEEDLDLPARARRAGSAKGSLLLSIHHDSPKETDFEPWDDAGTPRRHSKLARGFSLHVRGDRPDSVRFAKAIGAALLKAGFTPTRYHLADFKAVDIDRGIYDRRHLGLLNAATVPAVILECGFISHLQEELEIQKPEARAKLVEAVASAVAGELRPAEPP